MLGALAMLLTCAAHFKLQVVVLDPPGSQGAWEGYTYAPVWARAFSPQHAPTTLRELVRGAVEGHGGGELPPGAALCFRGWLGGVE